MKRVLLFGLLASLLTSPVMGISEFSKQWKDFYLTDNENEDFVRSARRASCNVCHIKGKDKKKDGNESRNEYGKALSKLLDHEEYTKEKIEEKGDEQVAKEIQAAFKKVESQKSNDGKEFGAKIKAGELPATDANL